MSKNFLKSISDDELLHRLSGLVQRSRRVESELVAHIAEVDERRLYAREAFPSMFAYCTEVLHLSEWEAYLRIAVARRNVSTTLRQFAFAFSVEPPGRREGRERLKARK